VKIKGKDNIMLTCEGVLRIEGKFHARNKGSSLYSSSSFSPRKTALIVLGVKEGRG
jgi:hypothetical protein